MSASDEEMDTSRALIQKRGQIKASLTRFSTFLSKCNESSKLFELEIRLTKVESLYNEFDNLQFRIESLDPSDENEDERVQFEISFFSITALAKEKLSVLRASSVIQAADVSIASSSNYQVNSTSKNVKLPILNLPVYHGEYEKWMNFKDTFVALIHSDNSINNLSKFHYLKSCLRGIAEESIKSLEVTDNNYEIAWDLLNKRFENKKAIKRTHLAALFDWPAIQRESHLHLRKMIDGITLHLKALEVIGESIDHWDTVIIFMFAGKLDHTSKRLWQESSAQSENPKLGDFISFLAKRCQLLEATESNTNTKRMVYETHGNTPKRSDNRTVALVTNNATNCPICKGPHYIYNCNKFKESTPSERNNQVKKLKVCLNCLRSNHFLKDCPSQYGCRKCGKHHNSLLHIDISEINKTSESVNMLVQGDNNTEHDQNMQMPSFNAYCCHKSEILLATVKIHVLDKDGKLYECRALLDSGSQSNFITITQRLCETLKLNKARCSVPIAGINNTATNISFTANTTIKSRFNEFRVSLPFLVIDKISHFLPTKSVDIQGLALPKDIQLADPNFEISQSVDMLLGANIFFELLAVGQISLGRGKPTLQKTKLGWIVSGVVPSSSTATNARICNLAITTLNEQIERFWNIEEREVKSNHSEEEMKCEDHFLATTTRDANGRFVVSLPIRDNIDELGDSQHIALNRFLSLEQKMSKNTNLNRDYCQFMKEYADLGHMTEVTHKQSQDELVNYLPHHAVRKETSSSTKTRVVFDASAKTSTGVSLNDKLMVGPTIQDNLFNILIRFRKHEYVIAGDIAKMYRQITIKPEQRDLQRILWRKTPNEPMQHFQLNTVTYGTAPASFLAIRCLYQLGLESQTRYPVASKIIMQDFYVDDVLTGSDNLELTKQIMRDLIDILNSACLPLRKWVSNNDDILSNVDDKGTPSEPYFIAERGTTKTLGLLWDPENDVLKYMTNLKTEHHRITKRVILSCIAQIFDPLGLVGPIIVKAKIILQRLWQLKIDWDESLPIDIHTMWVNLVKTLPDLNKIEIPRHVLLLNANEVQLHCFSDSSERAYGSCIYLRSTYDSSDNTRVRLLCAKSRVAPLKNISLPRLELCGALLAAELADVVKTGIDIKIDSISRKYDTFAFSFFKARSDSKFLNDTFAFSL